VIGYEYPPSFTYYKYEYFSLALQKWLCFLIKLITSYIYIYVCVCVCVCSKTTVRIFNSLSSSLQDVREFTPTIYIFLRFVCMKYTGKILHVPINSRSCVQFHAARKQTKFCWSWLQNIKYWADLC
jgi:hypothetical protein